MRFDLSLLFPPALDNRFRGHPVALWAFWALTLMTLWRSQHHLLAPDGGAQSIATIPLDSFGQSAADAVIVVFALWGLSQLIVAVIYALASLRYRSMIPMLYVLFIAEYAVRTALPLFKPDLPTTGTAPGQIGNLLFLAAGPVLLLLSLSRRRDDR